MEEVKYFDSEEGDLGTNSWRKDASAMVNSGCTFYPPIVFTCVHYGWVMGGVKDIYLFQEFSGYQYVGICASGLNQS